MMTEELYSAVQEILDTPTQDLTRNSLARDGGEVLFSELGTEIDEIKKAFRYLNPYSVNLLPIYRQNELASYTAGVLSQINRIRRLEKDPSRADNQQKQGSLNYFKQVHGNTNRTLFQTDLEGLWGPIVESVTLAHENKRGENIEPNIVVEKLSKLYTEAEHTKDKLELVLQSAQQDLGKKGVSVHSHSFTQQAIDYSREAGSWKIWSIVLVILNALLILAIVGFVIWGIGKESVSLRIEVGLFGAALISMLSFALVLCVRNYFAAKHNEVINRHKANCLGTYDTFVDSADPDRKGAVLIQATQTIFSHQRSGYLSKEAEITSPSPVIEIVRHLSTGAGDR